MPARRPILILGALCLAAASRRPGPSSGVRASLAPTAAPPIIIVPGLTQKKEQLP